MNLFDLVVVAGAVAAGIGGWRIGFLARAASWAGLLVGFFAGIKALPAMVRLAGNPGPSGTLLVVAMVLVIGAFLGQALGLIVGHRVRAVIPEGSFQRADHVAGAVAGATSVVLGLWLVAPIMTSLPGWPARLADTSTLVSGVSTVLPDAPDTGSALRSLVSNAGFPQVFTNAAEAPAAGAPPLDSGMTPEVAARVAASTVKILADGGGCNRIQEGSGFVVQQDVVVTNAHVIAGEERVTVQRPDGRRLRARVAVFDPTRDLAVLVVDELRQDPLGRGVAAAGDIGGVLGHPRGQETVRLAPTRIEREVDADGRDIYNQRPSRRHVFLLAGDLQPGDSGAPLVNGEGLVVGVAFAIAPDAPSTAYALTDRELDAVLAAFLTAPTASVGTGACTP